MEIQVGVAKVGKYAVGVSGDSVEVVERPRGGLSIVIVDGQGHGRAAKRTSHMIASKAASLIEDGARDGAVMRAMNDYLYAFRDGKVSATVTLLTADLDHQCFVISRNSNTPVIIGHQDGSHCLDSPVGPIGVRRLIRPAVSRLPLFPGTVLIGCTDGVTHAGRYGGKERFSFDWVYERFQSSRVDVQLLANDILQYAIELERGKPHDDMVVAVMSVADMDKDLGIRRMTVSYPF